MKEANTPLATFLSDPHESWWQLLPLKFGRILASYPDTLPMSLSRNSEGGIGEAAFLAAASFDAARLQDRDVKGQANAGDDTTNEGDIANLWSVLQNMSLWSRDEPRRRRYTGSMVHWSTVMMLLFAQKSENVQHQRVEKVNRVEVEKSQVAVFTVMKQCDWDYWDYCGEYGTN